jgi:Family of unknown function (DUF6491)
MPKKTFLSVLAISLLAGPAVAGKPAAKEWPELGVETHIPFPNYGAIRNFEANEDRGVWLEDRQRRWYYAKLLSPCTNLAFVEAIGFDTRGTSSFDRFSSIIVEGQRCQVEQLVTAEKPLPRKERLKLRNEVRAEARKAVAPDD